MAKVNNYPKNHNLLGTPGYQEMQKIAFGNSKKLTLEEKIARNNLYKVMDNLNGKK